MLNMSLLKTFTLFFFIYSCQGIKRCPKNDCISYISCPNALDRAVYHKNAESERLFRSALCGYSYDKGSRVPLVCCSDFDVEEEDFNENNNRGGYLDHPNAKLLPAKCGDINGDRIVGGKVANLNEFPWMALISYNTRNGLEFLCAGSIINSRYILTAAHCVKDKKIAGVRLGEFDIRYESDCQGEGAQFVCQSHLQDVAVEDRIIHEEYQGLPLVQNDIALLRVKDPIDFSFKNVAPICLPLSGDLINTQLESKQATVAGWGLTENGTDSDVLLKVTIPILTKSACQNIYNKKLSPGEKDRTENKLCAGAFNMDSCNGDSGGPLMLEKTYKGVIRTVQYGVVSYGPRQCGSSAPGIYTEVTEYVDWILNHIES